MKTNKTIVLSVLIKSVLAFLTGALIVSLFFAITGAIYSISRKATATLEFSGIYVEIPNVDFSVQGSTVSGCLKYNNGTSFVDIENLSLAQETNYTVKLPYISAEARSVAFYARAKFVYTFYDENDEIMNSVNEATFLNSVFTTYSTNNNSLLAFTSDWKAYSDGYYYYVADNSAIVSQSNLQAIGSSNNAENVNIFTGTNNEATITTGTWSAVNGGPSGVNKIKIELKIELIETGAVSTWSLS